LSRTHSAEMTVAITLCLSLTLATSLDTAGLVSCGGHNPAPHGCAGSDTDCDQSDKGCRCYQGLACLKPATATASVELNQSNTTLASNSICQADMSRLESIAKAGSSGRKPDGRCYSHVADYIDQSGYGGINKGGFDSAIPSSYWAEAHQFADYLNMNGNAARLGMQAVSLTNPYQAPAGSIVVVRAGTPGTVNPTAGDIAIKGDGDHFYNGGEMGYGGSGNFPPGNTYVLGIYQPTKCSGGGPSPPSPSGGCKACVSGGGGKACTTKCAACGSDCTNCINGGGGMACADRCC